MFKAISLSAKIMSLTICAIVSSMSFAADSSFFEKELKLRPNLYKISADELQLYLGTSYDNPKTISADELKTALEGDQKPFVINVLPASLYDDCHIVGSESAPLKELVEKAKDWERDRNIIVYCALTECDAGEKAYVLLSVMGFTNVIDYKGGIKEWFQLGYPTEGPAESAFLHMKSVSLSQCDLYPELLICSSARFTPIKN